MPTAHDMKLSFGKRLAFGLGRCGAAVMLSFLIVTLQASAQTAPNGLLVPGNAAVTGFSGAVAPAQVAPGVNPIDFTFIDVNGPSLRVIDLQNMRAPPDAQLIDVPKP